MACSACQNIYYEDIHWRENQNECPGALHHTSFEALKHCQGCEFCRMIVDAVGEGDALSRDKQWHTRSLYLQLAPSISALHEKDMSSLIVRWASPTEGSDHWRSIATFGLYIERSQEERKTLEE